MNKLYEKAINKWGEPLQLIVAIEEMSELTKEITKHIRDSSNWSAIADELADVEIMLAQIKVMGEKEKYWFNDVVESRKKYKLERLKERLNG